MYIHILLVFRKYRIKVKNVDPNKNIKKCIYIKTKHRSYKYHYNQHESNQTNKQKPICTTPAEHNEKRLMKFSAVPTKTLKTLKCLSDISFKMNDLYFCASAFFLLGSVIKVFIVNTRWNITIHIWHMKYRKMKHISFIKELGFKCFI